MKNTVLPALAAVLLLIGFTACAGGDQSSSESSASPPETAPSSQPAESAGPPAGEEAVSVDHILMAIEAAYGEDYPPDGEIPAEVLESEFGLTPDLYTEAKGVMAMISVHNDRVVVAKAAEGRGDDLEQALNDARDRKIQDTMQYPANLAKTNAAKVVRHGDYVAFLLVGVPDDSIEDPQSEEAKQYAEEQVQKAVDAILLHPRPADDSALRCRAQGRHRPLLRQASAI